MFLLLLLLAFAPAVLAQEPPVVEFSLVVGPQAPDARVLSNAAWAKELQKGRWKVLERGSTATNWEEKSYAFMGRKLPITYFDPRAEAAQVQYIDVGFLIECRPRALADQTIDLEIRIEKSQLLADNAKTAFVGDSRILVKPGQTVVLGATRGVVTATYLGSVYPEQSFDQNAAVLMIVSVK
jgi:hypothetical protein